MNGAGPLDAVLARERVTWLFLGDSITQGVVHTRGWRSYAELVTEHLRGPALRRRPDAVVNSAVDGSRTGDLLDDYAWRVSRFAPDVVLVLFGTNDLTAGPAGADGFADRLTEIVRRCREAGALVVLQTPPPVLPSGERTPELHALYATRVRAVAAHEHTLLVDHAAAWAAAAAARGEERAPRAWMSDAFHPNERGHRAMAREVLRALGLGDESSPVWRLGEETEEHV